MRNTPSSSVKHPAPRRDAVGWLRQLIGLFGAPTAWAAQMGFSEILSSHACYPHHTPLSAPLMPWLHPALAAISAACFAAALLAAWLAWVSWRRSRHEESGEQGHAIEVGEGRTRFLALVGAYSSGLFLIAILFTAISLLLVPSCQ